MRKTEIECCGIYIARVSGKITRVRVDVIRTVTKTSRNYLGKESYRDSTVYEVTNLATGRQVTFRSATKFRGKAKPDLANPTDI